MQIKTDLWVISNALFLDWIQLQILIEYRLSVLLKRTIKVIAFQDGDYWEVETDPISPEEMEMLFEITKADEEDRKNHSGFEWALKSLTEAFTQKLIAAELPFPIKTSAVVEDGVYFIGQDIPYNKVYQIPEGNAYEAK